MYSAKPCLDLSLHFCWAIAPNSCPLLRLLSLEVLPPSLVLCLPSALITWQINFTMSSGFSRMDFLGLFGLLELENGGLTATYTTFVGLLKVTNASMMMYVSNRLDNDNRLDDDNRLDEFETSRWSQTSRWT